jgi:hypothetical protein
MASPDPGLARLQEWMQRVVLNTAEDIRVALASPAAEAIVPASRLASVILPSRTLAPEQRLSIYHGMYPLRMVEALESDYGALAHLLGPEAFSELVGRYVTAHPSRSYTLNRLGDHLPGFIASSSGIRRQAFCADLARLEHAIAQVFDADESPVLQADAIAAVGERAASARVHPVAAFRLLAFKYPVNAYLQSVRDDEHDHPRLAAKATWVSVFRRNFVVRRLDLSRDQHALLAALAAGETIGAAVEATLAQARRRLDPEAFFSWFREWVAAGIFQSISV